MDSSNRKVKVELEKSVVDALIRKKRVGDTYSDVIKRLLKMEKI